MDQRLLILDDDPLTGQTIKSIAEFAQFDVRFTTSFKEFFSLLGSWQPHVITLDLVMPEMDGIEVIKELSLQNSSCKIIISSGVGSRVLETAQRTAREHGLNIVGVLPKPFTASKFRQLLNAALASDSPSVQPGSVQVNEPAPITVSLQELKGAISRQELFAAYHPKVLCKSGELAGFEALVRWEHPRYGLLNPDIFIPLAEEHGLIDDLTLLMLDKTLPWFRDFCNMSFLPEKFRDRNNLDKLTLSINLSTLSLSNNALFDQLTRQCRELGINPQRLIFELTESSAMTKPAESMGFLTRLRMRGFQLSIDDFGTGYSSMLQLVRLPFSEIKIDKSFIITSTESEESRAVVNSIINLGHSLGLKIAAEGIENKDTLKLVSDAGCDFMQGSYFSVPLTGDEIIAWISSLSSISNAN